MSAAVCRLVAAASLILCAGAVQAADRNDHGRSGGRDGGASRDRGSPNRGGDRDDRGRGNDRGGNFNWGNGHGNEGGRDRDRSGLSIRLNFGNSLFCEPPRRVEYCPPPRRVEYCPPPRRVEYCPPPRVVEYCPPRRVEYCPPPVVVCPPPRVIVERPREVVVVQSPPVYRETVVVERARFPEEPQYPMPVEISRPRVCDPAPVTVVSTQRLDPYQRTLPAAVIVTNGVREDSEYTSYISFGTKRVKTIVSISNVCGRLNATARLVGDGCELPELNAVSLKIRGDGDVWTGPMRCVEPAGARAEYCVENLRWRGGDNLQIELQVADALTKQCIRW